VVPKSMRRADHQQNHIFSNLSPEERVPKDHPMRPIPAMVDKVLAQLSPVFDAMCAKVGRPSIPPEKLLRAQLLQMLGLSQQFGFPGASSPIFGATAAPIPSTALQPPDDSPTTAADRTVKANALAVMMPTPKKRKGQR
jgi:hypothetical protein